MCGRYVSVRSDDDLTLEFDVEEIVGAAPRPSWNVAPTDDVRIIARRRPHGHGDDPDATPLIQLRTAGWGLIPGWAKDRKSRARMINARAETVATSAAFARAYAKRRCLVPADGWFEWRPIDTAGGVRTQPMYMTPTDHHPLAFAGLYEFWRDPSDPSAAMLTSCTIVTVDSTGPLVDVHDRMPLVLARDTWSRWLDPEVADPSDLLSSRDEARGEGLELRPVSTLVNKVVNTGAELIREERPVDEQRLF